MNPIFWSGRKRRCFQPMGNRNEAWRKVWNEIVFRQSIHSIWFEQKLFYFFVFFQESDFLIKKCRIWIVRLLVEEVYEIESHLLQRIKVKKRLQKILCVTSINSFKTLENPATPIKKEVAFGTSFVSPISRTRSNTRAVRTTRSSRAATIDGF